MLKLFLTTFLLSVPEAFIKIYFAIAVIQPLFRINYKRMVGYSLFIAVSSNVLHILLSGSELFFLIMLTVLLLSVKFILQISWVLATALTILSYVIQMVCEIAIVHVATQQLSLSIENIQQSIVLNILLPYLYLIPMLLIALWFRKRRGSINLSKLFKSKYRIFFILILFQLFIGIIIQALSYMPSNDQYTLFPESVMLVAHNAN